MVKILFGNSDKLKQNPIHPQHSARILTADNSQNANTQMSQSLGINYICFLREDTIFVSVLTHVGFQKGISLITLDKSALGFFV